VEKYISPGEKVELLALIGEFVFTIGLGYSYGVEDLKDLSLVVPTYITYGEHKGFECIFHVAI
jgi:hypothetical protein